MAEEASSGSRAAPPASAGDTPRKHDESEITGPSLGPHTVIEREPVEERLARHEQSEIDAMGKDKRRAVVGRRHGPSKTRQLALYGAFLAVLVALFVGGLVLVSTTDKGVGKDVPNTAPWAQPDARQIPAQRIQ
jgi:hypothetical protein